MTTQTLEERDAKITAHNRALRATPNRAEWRRLVRTARACRYCMVNLKAGHGLCQEHAPEEVEA